MFFVSPLRRVTIVALFLGSASCTLPDNLNEEFSTGIDVPARWSGYTATVPEVVDDQWLASFNDPALVPLVNRALSNNRDLQAASARLAESQALAQQSGANLSPVVAASFEADSARGSGSSTDNLNYGLAASWEADIWGSIRGTSRAASLNAVSEEALFEFTRQSIAAQIAKQWTDMRANAALLQVAHDERRASNSQVSQTRDGLNAETILEADLDLALAEFEEAEATLAVARRNLSTSKRAMDLLLGQYPDGQIAAPAWLPRLPPRPRAGVPSQLLERRPDVVAAERQVAAAFFRSEAARAARLPQLTLRAGVGASGSDFGEILDPDEIVWTLVGNLIAPIVDGGSRQAQVEVETARQRRALANYASTALVAFSEVEDALAQERYLVGELRAYQRVTERVRAANDFETERFSLGEVGAARVFDLQQRFFDARRDEIRVHAALLRNRINLHLALGGSF